MEVFIPDSSEEKIERKSKGPITEKIEVKNQNGFLYKFCCFCCIFLSRKSK